MLKMTTYPGMSLGGEVRESVSLDDDDISDVEDEVFIRDGKNSYKLAEEMTMKRPLMAPRRKLGKPDITSRLKAKPPCKAFCKPCCYIMAALALLIGLIVLVIILVSIFPLPLDKLRDWFIAKTTKPIKKATKLLPCSNLKVTNVWKTDLPLLTTDSPVRILDIDQNGIEDVIFGFGSGGNANIIPPDIFCDVLGLKPPCEGGITALNGSSGDILWRFWTNDTIFGLHCSRDLNGDSVEDCIGTGMKGTILAISSTDGSLIWKRDSNRMEVFVVNLIQDVDGDGIWDVLAAHTWLESKTGHLVILSGKSGIEIHRVDIPNTEESFYMPQTLNNNFTLFGSGGADTPGNLSVASTKNLINGNMTSKTIYSDFHKGILTESVLVDITGDNITDIITAMYNSTIVAINGANYEQIWNYTIANSICNAIATPAFFNSDNVTDFLVFYQNLHNITDNRTKTFIIDGKTGKPIYENSINGSEKTQIGALTISMESHGFDMFLFWTEMCTFSGKRVLGRDLDCGSFNKSLKLNALNQYDQPPGLEIFSSVNKTYPKLNYTSTILRKIRLFSEVNAKVANNRGQSEVDENYLENSEKVKIHKYGSSTFRHMDRQPAVKNVDFENNNDQDELDPKLIPNEYDWQPNLDPNPVDIPGLNQDYNYNSEDTVDNPTSYNQKQMFNNVGEIQNNRDPRSKNEKSEETSSTIQPPNYGLYDYKNIKMSRNRLLHDLDNLPSEILRDTYFKNRESQLRKSRFEQRDIVSHKDKAKQNQEVKKIIDEEKKNVNSTNTFNLWDLESEKEVEESKGNKRWRGRRQANFSWDTIKEIPSIGAVLKSSNSSNNTIDIIFITYWQPTTENSRRIYEQDINECIMEKISKTSNGNTEKVLYQNDCFRDQESRKRDLPFFNQIHQLRLGQLTVYRIRIECVCDVQNEDERCAKFQPNNKQTWPSYLGVSGNGNVLG